MGGKAKQRVKHNAKPSSSSRSAEQMQLRKLQGSTGIDPFSNGSDLSKIALVPGFTIDPLPDNFDNNVSSEFQLVLRKMSKKDPLTKKKALNEFIDLVNKSELETIKNVLPLWPRHYNNLATDPEHMVRELSQTALRTLVSKCKRTIAPYLKQLVPIWLLSQYDNHAPAASIAVASFKETFVGSTDRTQEVLLHCQAEILEHTTRNLTFHTASTLSSGKDLAPEEAEQKYQRAVVSSLKTLSFFVEKTGDSDDAVKIAADLKSLIEHPKFWSLSKTKNSAIKASWFEFVYHVLQSSSYKNIIAIDKTSLTTLSFQNIDDANAAVASFAWACVLTIQSLFSDWFTQVNLRKAVLPKLSALLRNGCNGNATTSCPNLLPFFSKITPEVLQDLDYLQFCRIFFGDLQQSICTETPRSKAEMNAVIKSYFECLRYLLQKLNDTKESSSDAELFALWLMNDNLIVLIKWFLEGNGIAVKCYFQQVASLIAFCHERCDDGTGSSQVQTIYSKLLEQFWNRSYEAIKETVSHEDISEACMERVIQLLQDLCAANPKFEGRNIKFCDNEGSQESSSKHITSSDCKETTKCNLPNKLIEPKLKEVVTQIVRLLTQKVNVNNSAKYIKYIHSLTQLFTDNEFYKNLSDDKTTLASVRVFQNLFDAVPNDREASELLVDIIFRILQNLQIADTLSYIKDFMKENSQENIKVLILQRLLSHPYCNEPEVRSIIAQPDIRALIINIAKEALLDNTKEKFNILHKCFFQVESGEVLIDRMTIDGILEILCEALFSADAEESIHACSSFLAQTMPVFCAGENASKDVKRKVFLSLFEVTMQHLKADDYIPEETLWEITTSWQDSLSSGDILMDSNILHSCGQIIEKYVDSASLECEYVDKMANVLHKFIICSTEHITDQTERLKHIDSITAVVFKSSAISDETLRDLKDLCTLLEASNCIGSAGTTDLSKNCLQNIKMQNVFRRVLLNISVIKKLVCKISEISTPAEEDYAEDYCDADASLLTQWSPNLLTMVIDYFIIGAVGESFLINNLYPVDEATEWYLVALSETIKAIISTESPMITSLIEDLLDKSLKEQNVSIFRLLQFMVHSAEYAQFEENATIVLAERFSDLFVCQGAFEAYVCSLQYLMPNLSAKALTMRSSIMQSEPNEIWIKFAMFRLLIANNFNKVSVNETEDKAIALAAFQLITSFIENSQLFNKEHFLYNTTIEAKPFVHINSTVEYINLLCALVENFPYQMTLKNWDALRLGLSSWTLSVSKSHSHYSDPKVFLFITRVLHLYETFKNFLLSEKQKSSTSVVANVIEEWDSLFAREVDLVIFNFFFKLCDEYNDNMDYECFGLLMKRIVPSIELIDYSCVYSSYRDSGKMDALLSFLLKNLSNRMHCLRMCSVYILRELTKYCVAADISTLEKSNESLESQSRFPGFHFLNNFDDYLTRYGIPVRKYLDEFSFKLAEISEFGPIDRDEALSYLLLWDCIIYVCAHSPLSLRSIYTSWVHESRYEDDYLHFLFRSMPIEVLRNHDSKIMGNDLFKGLTFTQLKDPKVSIEKLSCHMYAETLRKFPAIVRKWWNTCQSRQKTFVDKLTTNFVSSLICNEELKTIANRKEKHDNMQVTVHYSTREVLAVYSIDEARMELVITLAPNYPLGSVKIDCGKQIGGRGSSRNIGMQLSIFLTHQNGTICDGLTLWKSNLDKKFDGVEECYICYTVIHHETFGLPKLSCKTCKKKFHGPCLYKWFTTSSKSTCPICRNVF